MSELQPEWVAVLNNFESALTCSSTHNVSTFALGLLICLGMFVSYLPQHYKIIKSGTSEGFNPCNVLNIVLLQWDVIGCCSIVTVGTCIEHTLGIIQIVVQWMMFIIVFLLFLIYFPIHKRYIRQIQLPLDDENEEEEEGEGEEATQSGMPSFDVSSSLSGYAITPLELSNEWLAVHFAITLFTSVVLLSSNGASHPETRQWAGVLGVFSMLVATIQYLPQIWTTWRAKVSYSIAYSYYMLDS
ncbi:hypothetical protein BDF19DRAFT_432524 [Syncephalis fuscata]|nr:hypothetical protein BDF19DRAFT_432524 [Syncephalis fuscata]